MTPMSKAPASSRRSPTFAAPWDALRPPGEAGGVPGGYTARPGGRGVLPGPYRVFSDEAVALLMPRGYRAHRRQEGLPDCRDHCP
jgi:hypothetical protein